MALRSGRPGRFVSRRNPFRVLVVMVFLVVLVASVMTPASANPIGSRSSELGVQAPNTGTASDWPTYLGNVNRTSNSTAESWLTQQDAGNLTVSWTYAAGKTLPDGSTALYSGIVSSTTVANDLAYFGSWNGYEYALRVTTHQLVWSTWLGIDSYDATCGPTNGIGISSAPTEFGGDLYLGGNNVTGGNDSEFYALNASTGQILWSVDLGDMYAVNAKPGGGNYSWSSPLVYDEDAYIGLSSNCDLPLVPAGLVEINLATNLTAPTHGVVHRFNTMPTVAGKELLGASIWTSPALDPENRTIFITTGNPAQKGTASPPKPQNYSEAIVALNATTLQLESSWQVPAIEVTGDGDFGAGGTVLHDVTVGGRSETLVVAGNKNGEFYAWNASNLSRGPLWKVATGVIPSELITPAAYGDGLIFVDTPSILIRGTTAPGGILALYPNNGTIAWEQSLLGKGVGAPLYANGVILAEAGHYLQFINATDGHTYSDLKCSAPFVSAPSIAEGFVWAGCEDGTEYVLTVPGGSSSPSASGFSVFDYALIGAGIAAVVIGTLLVLKGRRSRSALHRNDPTTQSES